jgi:hypothetical protein
MITAAMRMAAVMNLNPTDEIPLTLADVARAIDRSPDTLAVWQYCFASARALFGDRLGHPIADEILAALRRVWPESLTRTEISGLFHRNRPASEITQALTLLAHYKLAECDIDRAKDRRPVERWVCTGNEINETDEITPDEVADISSD